MSNDIKCTCGSTAQTLLTWEQFLNGTRHIREECATCRRFLRWAPQTDKAKARAVEPANRKGSLL